MGILDILGMGSNKSESIQDFKDRGAILVDVRSKAEFAGGNAPGSINIPLDQILSQVDMLKKKNMPVLVACVSGARSGQAQNVLSAAGVECFNAGPWANLKA